MLNLTITSKSVALVILIALTGLPALGVAKEQFVILLPINVNQADQLTLSRALKGVGPKKADAIIAYRTDNGPFKRLHDLLQVRGIGPGTLAKNRGRMSVD